MKPMVVAAHVEVAARRLWSRVEAALVERSTGFSDREAGDFLTNEIPDGAYVPGLDHTVEDLEPVCPKCPHWRHTGDECAACSCVSTFIGDTTRETGPRFQCRQCGKFITTPIAIPADPGLFCSVCCQQAAQASAPPPVGALDGPAASLPPTARPAHPQDTPAQAGSQQRGLPPRGGERSPRPAPSPGQLLRDINDTAAPLAATVLTQHQFRWYEGEVRCSGCPGAVFADADTFQQHRGEIIIAATATALDALQK